MRSGSRPAPARQERGQELVEFALISPVLFILLFAILEFGVYIWRYNSVAVSAREGARAAISLPLAVPDEYRVAAAEEAAEEYFEAVGLVPATAHAEVGGFVVGEGEYPTTLPTIVVEVSYTHSSLTGLFPAVTMQANSTMLLE